MWKKKGNVAEASIPWGAAILNGHILHTLLRSTYTRHSREGGNPGFVKHSGTPAFAGVTDRDVKRHVHWYSGIPIGVLFAADGVQHDLFGVAVRPNGLHCLLEFKEFG